MNKTLHKTHTNWILWYHNPLDNYNHYTGKGSATKTLDKANP